MDWMTRLVLLAQAANDPNAPAPEGGPPAANTGSGMFIWMIGGLAIFMLINSFFGRSDTKEKSKRDQFIGSLKKNDLVVTIGGILGTVVSVTEDRREVTIKVDDNTRLKMQASAIREAVNKETKEPPKTGE